MVKFLKNFVSFPLDLTIFDEKTLNSHPTDPIWVVLPYKGYEFFYIDFRKIAFDDKHHNFPLYLLHLNNIFTLTILFKFTFQYDNNRYRN